MHYSKFTSKEYFIMIYGFIHDTMFKQDTLLEYGDSGLPPVCYLDDNIEGYFNNKLTVTDPRSVRNVPTYNGIIKFNVDADKLDTDHIFTVLNAAQISTLFSLFEEIYTTPDLTESQLNTFLNSDPTFQTIYVPDSLQLGNVFVSTELPETHIGPKTMVDYFRLDIHFGAVTETFKVWMNRAKFATDYPLSTINKVVLPCEHTYLLNPNNFTNIVDTLILSNEFSFSALDANINAADHTGLITYRTKYNVSSTSVKMMPFGILYKGATPSSLDIRKAIRDLLISYGTASSEVWEALFPDLFVTGQFFIVPMWDNVSVRVDRTLFPSILPVKKIDSLLQNLYPNMEDSYIKNNKELLLCAQSEIFLLSLPDTLNAQHFSILEMHPTYQYYSPQNQIHAYMEPKTKDFNIRLNRCMAVLSGETVLEEFIVNTFDGKRYLSFVSYETEYHVLYREDYLTFVDSLN